jgi:uncharacterized membrane protein SpoIIM required for sporulation
VRFRQEREREWAELEDLTATALRRGLKALGEEDLQRLPVLYRAALSSLSVARRTAMDRELVQYLETLAARAYLAVYGSRRPSRRAFREFLGDTFPRAVRSMSAELGLSTLLFALGVAVAYALTAADPEWYYAFTLGSAQGRTPASSTEDLRATLYASEGPLTTFASFLFTHNARIGMTAFALGFAAGVPTALLLFLNGLNIGAFVALFASRGLLVPVLGWLLPHGIPEIMAVLLCGAAGLHLGRAMVWPGQRTVRTALVNAGRPAALVVAGAVLLFAYAGAIEGVFRQTVQDEVARFGMATFNAAWLAVWLVLSGRSRKGAP